MKPSATTRSASTLLTLLTLAVAVGFAMPLLAMLIASVQPTNRLGKPLFDHDRPILAAQSWLDLLRDAAANYQGVLSSPIADFPLYLKNSLAVSFLASAAMTLSSAAVAFALARLNWKGRDAVFALVLASLLIPFPVVMAPLYLVFRNLGWIGTLLPLWAPACFGGAFSIFLLRQFFLSIPKELDEAARLDGCSEFSLFTRVILPISAPALAVTAILQFVASWNDFLSPLLFVNHQDLYTVALGLHMFQSQHGGAEWNSTMAATLIAIAPVLILFALAHRSVQDGIATQGLNS